MPEGALALTDVTTDNMDTTKHGFVKKGSGNTTDYLDGTNSWTSTTEITITNFTNATHTHANASNGNQLGRTALGYPAFPWVAFTTPVSGNYSWVNQGGASLDTTSIPGAIGLNGPAGAGNNLRIRIKSAPATPYTIDGYIIPVIYSVNAPSAGLIFRESSSGKLVSINVAYSSNPILFTNKWTNPTTFSATAAQSTMNVLFTGSGGYYLRMVDDGTNRKTYLSVDGINWFLSFSETRTTFMTADQVGFFVDAGNASNPAFLWLMSWLES